VIPPQKKKKKIFGRRGRGRGVREEENPLEEEENPRK
jgi:hypothetical protein